MLVMKFGGTSLGNAQRIRTTCGLVKKAVEREADVLVVVSAHGGVTDMLIKAAQSALGGDALSGLSALETRHREIVEELGLDMALIADELRELGTLLNGVSMLRELSDRTLDLVQSFGERMSSKVVAALLRREAQLTAEAIPSYDLGLLTDDRFGEATVKPESQARIAADVARRAGTLLVTTGFLAKSPAGDITTLGRGGSDYTAAIFGAALGAREIQIWTDVDGVMSADPSVIPQARPIARLTFAEASEVAYYGGRVLHPMTMVPAVKNNIPIRVLNTTNPDHPGTLLSAQTQDPTGAVKSIVYKENITLLDVTSNRMLMQAGFMSWLFKILNKHEIVIGMISTSEVTVSLTTDNPKNLPAVVEEIEASGFARARVSGGKAITCVVGSGMRSQRGLAAKVFSAIAEAGVNIQLISQGASEINIAVLVNNEDIEPTVRALHETFFESE